MGYTQDYVSKLANIMPNFQHNEGDFWLNMVPLKYIINESVVIGYCNI